MKSIKWSKVEKLLRLGPVESEALFHLVEQFELLSLSSRQLCDVVSLARYQKMFGASEVFSELFVNPEPEEASESDIRKAMKLQDFLDSKGVSLPIVPFSNESQED